MGSEFTRQRTPASKNPPRSVIQRQPASLVVNKTGDRFEQEADRMADAVVSGQRQAAPFSLSAVPITRVQREDVPKDKTNEEKIKDAGDKLKDAFLATPLGKDLQERVRQDRLVKDATEAGKSFIATLPGKIITGAAAAGAVATLAALHKELPAQVPEIPLDVLTPGLSVQITYKGPVDKPTEAMITFKFTEQAPEGSGKKPTLTDSEKYRAETARMAADQAKFKAGYRYPPGSPEDVQQKAEEAAAKSALAKYAPGPDLDAMIKKYPWLGAQPPKSGLQLTPPTPSFGRKPPSLLGDEYRLKLPGEQKKKDDEPVLQRQASSEATADAAPPVVHAALSTPGQPLDAGTRTFMEARFGHDFGQVRVHTDALAAESARAVSAVAYTVGRDIVFGAGRFAPGTHEGRRLVAHELTHAIQQSGSERLHVDEKRGPSPIPMQGYAADVIAQVAGQKVRLDPVTGDQGEKLTTFPHHHAIARAFGMQDFKAPATLDPAVRHLGAEAATQNGHVRFGGWPSLEVAAHEAAHIFQGRGTGRRTDVAGADRHAAAVAGRVTRGLGAIDLLNPSALVSAATSGPLFFVPSGAAPATHTVVAGETLQSIATDVYGEDRYAAAIALANKGVVAVSGGVSSVKAGDVLTLPDRPDPADPWVNPYVSKLLRKGGTWTQAEAEATLLAFAAESAGTRDTMVAHYVPFNNIAAMLLTLPTNSTQAGGAFETKSRDLLQRIQRVGARADAASQGLADENAMAQAQANEMTARNKAAAKVKLGGKTPTTAQVAAQQSSQAAQGSIAPQTAVMTAAQETALNNTLNTTSIPAFVTWATTNQPGLGITAAHLRADARAIFDRGIGIIAFADGTSLRAVVGESFLDMVAANPAYALPTVVHEIWGHNTYEGRGNYGSPGAAYGLDVYDKAAAKMPGYVKPTGAGRTSEIDNYGYHETEMYSLMREVPYYTPNAPAHSALAGSNYDPAPEIKNRIKEIQKAFEARVARSLLRGLYLRFVADPTVSGSAMSAFRTGVTAVFPAADATAILR